jgi:hypothetical protein
MDKSKYDAKRLDHLGLVAGFCKEIGLNESGQDHLIFKQFCFFHERLRYRLRFPIGFKAGNANVHEKTDLHK